MISFTTLKKKINSELFIALFLITSLTLFITSYVLHYTSRYGNTDFLYFLILPVLYFFIIFHAIKLLQLKNALILLLITFSVTLTLEYIGTQGLIPYCNFYYTEQIAGPKILGEVPFLVPLSWLMIFYCGLIMSYIIIKGLFEYPIKNGRIYEPKNVFIGAIITGLIVVSWDILLEPSAVGYNMWVWKNEGIYYGVPLMNFIGWFVISVVIFLIFHLYLQKTNNKILFEKYASSWFIFLVILAYLLLLSIETMKLIGLEKIYTLPLGFFSMGFFILITTIGFKNLRKNKN